MEALTLQNAKQPSHMKLSNNLSLPKYMNHPYSHCYHHLLRDCPTDYPVGYNTSPNHPITPDVELERYQQIPHIQRVMLMKLELGQEVIDILTHRSLLQPEDCFLQPSVNLT